MTRGQESLEEDGSKARKKKEDTDGEFERAGVGNRRQERGGEKGLICVCSIAYQAEKKRGGEGNVIIESFGSFKKVLASRIQCQFDSW